MEDIIVPLLTFLLIVGSSIVKSFNEDKEKRQRNERKPETHSPTVQRGNSQAQQASKKSYQQTVESVEEQKTEQLDQLKKELNVSRTKTMEDLEKAREEINDELDQLLVSRKKQRALENDQIKIKDYLT